MSDSQATKVTEAAVRASGVRRQAEALVRAFPDPEVFSIGSFATVDPLVIYARIKNVREELDAVERLIAEAAAMNKA